MDASGSDRGRIPCAVTCGLDWCCAMCAPVLWCCAMCAPVLWCYAMCAPVLHLAVASYRTKHQAHFRENEVHMATLPPWITQAVSIGSEYAQLSLHFDSENAPSRHPLVSARLQTDDIYRLIPAKISGTN
jgi:hypothetical protein